MTYSQLQKQLPPSSSILTLGGKASITILNPGSGDLQVVNTKGKTYRLSHVDWIGAKSIRNSHPRNPWVGDHYTSLSQWFSYSLIYAAALLRHVEREEQATAPKPTLLRFSRKAQDMHAA